MKKNENWILIIGVLLCVAVTIVVDVLWVRMVVMGGVVLSLVGMLIWLKVHSVGYIKNRVVKILKRKGIENGYHNGDFYVIMSEKKYKVTFLESGWRVNRVLFEARILMPYYDKLSRNERCLMVEEMNEEYPYVKMVAMGDCIKCGYMGMVEYAGDLLHGIESAEYYIVEQADGFYRRIFNYADDMGWVKRDHEGNVIYEDDEKKDGTMEDSENGDGVKHPQMHKDRVVVRGLFEPNRDKE